MDSKQNGYICVVDIVNPGSYEIRKVKNNRDVEYKNTHSNYTNNDTAMEPTNSIINNSVRLNRTSQQILKIIKLNPGCSSPIIANKTKKSLPTIKRHIAELKEMGLIEFIGASKNAGYYLK